MLKTALLFAVAAFVLSAAAPLLLADLRALQPAETQAPVLASAEAPAPAPERTPAEDLHGEKTIAADAFGQYSLDLLIDGERVHMMVDTGASFVSVSSDLADRLGLPRGRRGYVKTADGVAPVTETVLPSVDLGTIYMKDVPALIADRKSSRSGEVNLLGASFLKRLASVESRNGVLVLRQ